MPKPAAWEGAAESAETLFNLSLDMDNPFPVRKLPVQ